MNRLKRRIRRAIGWRLRKMMCFLQLYKLYYMHKKDFLDMNPTCYRNEFSKFRRLLSEYGFENDLWTEIQYFYTTTLKMCYDSFSAVAEPENPILIVVVKNELERMKLFYQHYQRIGVSHFVVIDNNSTDGTYEWVCRQKNTAVYKATDEYTTTRRVAWIQRALAKTGYHRWYIVVDSDELLDYIGRESHRIQECISFAEANHCRRFSGLLIDMYSANPLFSEDCTYTEMEAALCYFDSDSYLQKTRSISPLYKGIYFTGGPRGRILHSETQLAKQCVFYYGKDDLYFNSHFLLPIIGWEQKYCCFAIRHYKFLKNDLASYWERTRKGGFAFGSRFYKDMFHEDGTPRMETLLYKGSVRYEGSDSLRCLPYLTELQWDDRE